MTIVKEKMNDLNLNFYNNLDIDPFKLLAQVGGFHTYKDLELIYPYIKYAKNVLEIGAGYGRCIDFLMEKKFEGEIIAIEQSPKLVSYLQTHYAGIATIVQENIKQLHLPVPIEAALWMWSGLIDFSHQEQEDTFVLIAAMLASGGRLAVDVPKSGFKTIGEHSDEKNIVFETSYGTLHCYIPDQADISSYALKSGLKIIFRKNYYTSTEKQRTMFVLEKK